MAAFNTFAVTLYQQHFYKWPLKNNLNKTIIIYDLCFVFYVYHFYYFLMFIFFLLNCLVVTRLWRTQIYCLLIFFSGQLRLTPQQRNRLILRPSTRPNQRLISSTMATLLRRQRLSLQGTSNANDLRQQILRLIASRRSGSRSASSTLTGTQNRSRPATPPCPEISCLPVPANCRRVTYYMTTAGRRCRGCDFNRCEDFESRWGKGFSIIE